MPYINNGARHGFPKVIEHKKQIPKVVKPGGYISYALVLSCYDGKRAWFSVFLRCLLCMDNGRIQRKLL